MGMASEPIAKAFLALMERAVLSMRMRIRYGKEVSQDEIHDFLDALHNVPTMLREYGGWHVEENIEANLETYDRRWVGQPGSKLRHSLMEFLTAARQGEFDH